MDGDSVQEDRLAVKQYLSAAGFDGAETDEIGDGIFGCGYLDFVEFGRLRRPALKSRGGEEHAGAAVIADGGECAYA